MTDSILKLPEREEGQPDAVAKKSTLLLARLTCLRPQKVLPTRGSPTYRHMSLTTGSN